MCSAESKSPSLPTQDANGGRKEATLAFDSSSTKTAAASDSFPTLGVSLDVVLEFASKAGGRTTKEVCDDLIKPVTKTKGVSYVDMFSESSDKVGRANVFVSHAWQYKFADVASSLLCFARKNPGEHFYFWFDVYTVNQHNTESVPAEWWYGAFRDGIQSIGRTVLVLSPWRDPIPLTRSWCLCRRDSEHDHDRIQVGDSVERGRGKGVCL